MKKIILALAAALISIAAFAIPAKKGAITYTQPDGSTVRIELHGDEFFHWATLAGTNTVVEMDDDGFWRLSSIDEARREQAMRRRAAMNQYRRSSYSLRSTHNSDPMTHGARHIPVLLVNFSDKSFSISNPNEKFTNLLNQDGYSANGGTGSVRNFYMDNSHGAFEPIFDVYGPVTLSQNMAYYGGNANSQGGSDKQPELAVLHAAQLLDGEIDFSKYDYDNDDEVDMILMYYAGYNEAEGGPKSSIWPHQWSLRGQSGTFDTKYLGAYFCTSELKGASGTNMCGIGTTCHEFGHSLGLPDFYDTDYEGSGGEAGALYDFSTMCGGAYNNDGRTPPYFNAEERIFLGWMSDDDIIDLPAGSVTIAPANDEVTYRSYTDVEGEYFLYECRDGNGWDAPLPKGLLIYHADKSTTRSVGGLTPYNQWNYWTSYNSINAYGAHPCFYLIPSASLTSLYYYGYMTGIIFPGSKNVTSYTPIDWNGHETGVVISGISFTNGAVNLTATYSTERVVTGKVSDQSGKPVSGVKVSLSELSSAGAPGLRIAKRGYSLEAVTDSNGAFNFELAGFEGSAVHLFFQKEGWVSAGKDVELKNRTTEVNITLLKEGEGQKTVFSYYDPSGDWYVFGDNESTSLMAAIKISANELPADGGVLSSVDFPTLWPANYYVIVDAGSERILNYKVPGIGTEINYDGTISTVDLSGQNVEFPGGTDLYVGVGVENAQCQSQYLGRLFYITVDGVANCYVDYLNFESSDWYESEYALVYSATVIPKGDVPPVDPPQPEEITFATMGFASIADPGNGSYKEGSSFALDLLLPEGITAQSVSWFFDDVDLTGCQSVPLIRGTHVVTAKANLSDGSKETLQLIIQVQ